MEKCNYFPRTLINIFTRVTCLLILMLVIHGCSKDKMTSQTVSDRYELDKSVFFTINIEGISHTSNAYRLKSGITYYTFPLVYRNQIDEPGGSKTQHLSFSVSAEVNLPEAFKLGTCNAFFTIKHPGDIPGTYTALENPTMKNQVWIHNGKTYNIDATGLEFTISNVSDPNPADRFIEGSFRCNLKETSGSAAIVPATGTFRMKML